MHKVKIGNRGIGEGHPVFFIAEIGINHNGDIGIAKKLIDVAHFAGCDAVKFQKRNPEEAVPEVYKDVKRETPWGIMDYLDYRKRLEFWENEYNEIDRYCRDKGIMWSVSCWDISSLRFIDKYGLSFLKVPSALITHKKYLERVKEIKTKRQVPVFLSTGMSDMESVEKAVGLLGEDNLVIMHAVGTYPVKHEDVNLNIIRTLKDKFNCPIGYSGHEVGLQISLAAVALGASVIERHITLDRSMWGTDQAASVETSGVIRLIRDIRIIERSFGSSDKRILDTEKSVMEKLRKVDDLS
ncbi:MAG: N-acetylneuraminate synthase family protein [Candidatus Omnitrophica bacterium]|nr:N-acetylneuraminate synthase family protein [Candidatus Omnitrophota bacterium]